jgi:hypothetical protein
MEQNRVDLFICPECRTQFQVKYPDPVPDYLCNQSKITMTCPVCHETFELFNFLIDLCKMFGQSNLPFIEVTSITPKQLVPENTRMEWMRLGWERQRKKHASVYAKP